MIKPSICRNSVLLAITFFLIFFAFGVFSTVPAEAAAVVGKFTVATGKVDVLKGGSLPATSVKAGDVVEVKDVIRTKSNSQAEVLFNDGNTLKIEQRSRVDISEYVSEDGKGKRVINLPRGKIEATVLPKHAKMIEQSPGTHSFEIHTPNAVAGVRGTTYKVLHINNVTWVFVLEGTVNVYNPKFPDQVQLVPAGFMIMIPPDGPPLPPQPIDPLLMGFDLNNWPGGTETGSTQTDTTVVEPVTTTDNNVPPIYIPPPAGNSFDGTIGICLDPPCEAFAFYGEPWPIDGGLYWDGEITGTFSGADFWSSTYTASGTFTPPSYDYDLSIVADITLFGVPFKGRAADKTAFVGGIGGRVFSDGQLDGGIIGAYITPWGTAGTILSTDMTGTAYADNKWNTSGTFITVDMGTTGFSPDDLYEEGPAVAEFSTDNGSVENLWDDNQWGTASYEIHAIADQGWGIIWGEMGNTYNTTPTSNWDIRAMFEDPDCSECDLLSLEVFEFTGTTNTSNNTMDGKFIGYAANIDPAEPAPEVGIFIGETHGTYDTGTSTWQAQYMGYVFLVGEYLSMTETPAGRSALQQLNIPAVEVGRAGLTGSRTGEVADVSISMNDVIFFAPSTGQEPAIWATGNVSGTYTGNPALEISSYGPIPVSLTGNGLSAVFNMQSWIESPNRWIATISGSGNYSGTGTMNGTDIIFKGAGAGTFTGTTSGALSGAAAGTVTPGAF